MATFIAATASSTPLLKDADAVKKIMERYCWDGDVTPMIQPDDTDRRPRLAVHGGDWPGAWKVPDGIAPDEFERDYDIDDLDANDGFEDFLKEIAPFLAEPLVIQSVGFENCRFPVSACEWRIVPGGSEIEINGFKHSLDEPTIVGADL